MACLLRTRAALTCLALAASTLTFVAPAHAEGPEESAEFFPALELLLLGFDDAAVDTGWIPGGSPVQMRFFADAANSITISLPGQAHYDWRTESLRFEGDEEAGFFEYDVGLELQASVKFDVGIAQWESDILGPYDWGVEAIDMFTPYLLEGNPDRPAMISDESGAFTLVSVPIIPDVVVAEGNLDIDLFVEIEAQLQCNRIEVTTPGGEVVEFTQEGQSLPIDPGEGSLDEDLVLPAQAHCLLQTMPILIIYPNLVMEILFTEYDVGGIEIPIDLPVVDEEISFDTIDLSFPRWEPPEPEDTGESGESAGESESDEGNSDEIGDEVGDTEGDTGDGPSQGELLEDGCNCSTEAEDGPGRAASWSLLGLLGLTTLRRRRR